MPTTVTEAEARRCLDNGRHLSSSRHRRVECPAEEDQ